MMSSENPLSPTRFPMIRLRPKQRASHTKSRNGCYTCKQRRVKCDEVRPVCGACSLRGNRCSFPNRPEINNYPGQPALQPDAGSRDWPKGMQQLHPVVTTPLRPLELGVIGTHTTEPSRNPGDLNMTELRLLQHFILHTSKKISCNSGRTHVWQNIIPGIAAENEYLMHLLLALAGLDLFFAEGLHETTVHASGEHQARPAQSSSGTTQGTFKDPHDILHHETITSSEADSKSAHLHAVIEHHQKGLQGFREELEVLSESNAEAVFSGSILLVAFAFASLCVSSLDHSSPSDPANRPPSTLRTEPSLPRLDWLYLVRGLTSLVGQQWFVLRTGRLRCLLVYNIIKADELYNPMIDNTLANLPPRLAAFAKGSRRAVSNLKAFMQNSQLAPSPMAHSVHSGADTPHSSADERGTSSATRDPREELSSTIDFLDQTYRRIQTVLVFSDSGSNRSAHAELQAELEEAGIMSWPHTFSHEFVASLDSGEESGLIRGQSLTILAHFYVIGSLFEDVSYIYGGVEREIMKIHALVKSLGDTPLAYLMQWPMEVIAARSPSTRICR